MAPSLPGELQHIAKAAYDTTTAAAWFIPDAWPSAAIMYGAQSDPAQLMDAANAWYEVKQELVAADKEIQERLSRFSEENWSGKDRDAFETQMHEYQNQIRVSYSFALVVHAVLKLMAIAIAAFIIFMAICAAILAFYAAWVALAMASAAIPVVGQMDLAASEAAAEETAAMINGALEALEAGISRTGAAGAAIIGGMMTIDVLGQMVTGNTQAFPDFVQATAESSDDVALGTLTLMEQKITGNLMKGEPIGGLKVGRWKVPEFKAPQGKEDIYRRIAGSKGAVDTGTPFVNGGFLGGGSPTASRGVTTVAQKYDDDYVERTNPLPVNPEKTSKEP